MKIKKLVIYFIKKTVKSNYPLPFFYRNGIVIIKLILEMDVMDMENHPHILQTSKI